MKNPEALALAMDYATAMESCAAYVAVKNPAIRTPEDAATFLRPIMFAATDNNSQEAFFTALLDVKNRVIGIPRECTRGLLASCPIEPSVIFRSAVKENAASVILAHVHPSNDPTPSKEDIDITRRLVEAAKILGIRIVDHVIIGRPCADHPGHVSLREKNLVAFD